MEALLLRIPFIKNLIEGSWVTTISGYVQGISLFAAAIVLGWEEIQQIWDVTETFEWNKIKESFALAFAAFAAGVGGKNARDENKTSEQVGAATKRKQEIEKTKQQMAELQEKLKALKNTDESINVA